MRRGPTPSSWGEDDRRCRASSWWETHVSKSIKWSSALTPSAEPWPIAGRSSAVKGQSQQRCLCSYSNKRDFGSTSTASDVGGFSLRCVTSLHWSWNKTKEGKGKVICCLTRSRGRSRRGWRFQKRWQSFCRYALRSWRETHTRSCSRRLSPRLDGQRERTRVGGSRSSIETEQGDGEKGVWMRVCLYICII